MAPRSFNTRALAVLAAATCINALQLDVSSASSIKDAASTVAYGMMSSYKNNQTSTSADNIGLFGKPTYFWEDGAIWGDMIAYAAYTNDTSYNPTVTQALLAQTGPNKDYLPSEQVKSAGNDDQGFWSLACMNALELGYPSAPSNESQWLDLAETVWNAQAARWDTATCGAGLRWQIFAFNVGYDYKNSISNAVFFQLSARLARYTGNQTYSTWAEKTWTWLTDVGLIDSEYDVFDGTDVTTNCSDINHILWSYNYGALIYGAAMLYNISDSSSTWRDRVQGLTKKSMERFSSNNVLTETACETQGNCNNDQITFKGIHAGWLARSILVAPFLRDETYSLISTSAKAAAEACTKDVDGRLSCPLQWTSSNDSTADVTGAGVSEQLSALGTIQALLLYNSPVTIRRQSDGASPGSSSNSTGPGSNSSNNAGANGTNGNGGTGAANSLMEGSSLVHLAIAVLFGLSIQLLM